MPTLLQQRPLLGKFRLNSNLVVETGLHIGGGGEKLDIGGLDHPVIRNPWNRQPYLPGSSIKGKLRAILERLLNKPLNRPGGSDIYRYESDDLEDGYTHIDGQDIPYEGAKTCPISRLFGSTGSECWIESSIATEQRLSSEGKRNIKGKEYTKIKGRNAPARLIVRDSHLLDESAKHLETIDTGLYMTEWKFENSIDRVTAAANPRQLERVPAGSIFKFELVYTVEDWEQAKEDLRNIAIALAILEDDALGGHGSRGYGKIRFEKFEFFYRNLDRYRQVTSGSKDFLTPIQTFNNTSALLENFENLTNEIQKFLPENGTNEEQPSNQ
jgi:CRISPR-associated protein Csm3